MKTVGEISSPADEINASETVVTALKRLRDSRNGFLVVTEGKKVKGVLAVGDVFRAYFHYVACHYPTQKHRETYTDLTQYFDRKKFLDENKVDFAKQTVKELMNTRPKIVQKEVQIPEAVELMKTFDLKSLAVINENHELIGVINRTDLLLEELEE
ncbi:hypothetical protein AUJ65_03655 [Candidatus Micrarchaeota archaeon CG1_02_51_15]|nr:MAG: hypothetical protein AUJ65_03655 [Candidatus Micrarchaeota archaeon CG1_02_51_15]